MVVRNLWYHKLYVMLASDALSIYSSMKRKKYSYPRSYISLCWSLHLVTSICHMVCYIVDVACVHMGHAMLQIVFFLFLFLFPGDHLIYALCPTVPFIWGVHNRLQNKVGAPTLIVELVDKNNEIWSVRKVIAPTPSKLTSFGRGISFTCQLSLGSTFQSGVGCHATQNIWIISQFLTYV